MEKLRSKEKKKRKMDVKTETKKKICSKSPGSGRPTNPGRPTTSRLRTFGPLRMTDTSTPEPKQTDIRRHPDDRCSLDD